MSQSSFGEALSRPWPNGDAKIPGLRAGMFAVSFFVIACINAAHANEATLPFGYNCADVRGRGAAQTRGREGYQRLAKAVGLDVANHPDLVNDPKHFLECGVADFISCGCLPAPQDRSPDRR